jgi:hypothetical protein
MLTVPARWRIWQFETAAASAFDEFAPQDAEGCTAANRCGQLANVKNSEKSTLRLTRVRSECIVLDLV